MCIDCPRSMLIDWPSSRSKRKGQDCQSIDARFVFFVGCIVGRMIQV